VHGLAHAIEGEVDSEPKFYSSRTIFSDTAADSENFLWVFDRRSQIDKYCAKIPRVRWWPWFWTLVARIRPRANSNAQAASLCGSRSS